MLWGLAPLSTAQPMGATGAPCRSRYQNL